MGPGIITASADNDAGGITTYSLAGSQFGYVMLWTLIPMTVSLAVVQEMGVRMGIVSGKGLAALIREKTGLKLVFFIMVLLVAVNFGNTLAEFSGIAVSASIFGVPPYASLPLAALFVWVIIVHGNYKSVEKVFLVGSALYFTYIISGFLAHPDWKIAAVNTFIPNITLDAAYVTMLVGLVGTTISPWMQFYIQASVVEKRIPLKNLFDSRLDAINGSIACNVVSFFIIVACAATIFAHGIPVNNVADISGALAPLAGHYASVLFAFGFLNASLFAASVLPLSTAYSFCEGIGLESGVSKTFREAPVFYGLFTATIVLAAFFISLPNVPLLSILYLSQVGNGILLPFILIYMLVIANDKKIMGEYANTRTYNYVAWATVVIMIGLSISLIFLGSH